MLDVLDVLLHICILLHEALVELIICLLSDISVCVIYM